MNLRTGRAGFVISAVLLGAVLSGCVVADRHPVVEALAPHRPPPPPRVEIVPAPPRPREFVEWRPGYWRWDGREYVWLSGSWIEKRRPVDSWAPGHWEERRDRWVWVEGGWR
jgi:hypothetical protein